MLEGKPEGNEPHDNPLPPPFEQPFSAAGGGHEEPVPLTVTDASALEHRPEPYHGPGEGGEGPQEREGGVEAPDLIAVEHELLDRALGYAGNSLEDRAYVASLSPDGSELVRTIQEEALALPPERRDRLAVLADLSRRPDSDAAWDGALDSAQHIGTFHQMGEQVHALEQLASTQTDSHRLDAIMNAGLENPDAYAQARIMRATITQRARIGDDAGVMLGTLGMDYSPVDEAILDQAYEAAIALIEVNMRGEDTRNSEEIAYLVDGLYHPFKAWGEVVVAKYADPETANAIWEQTSGDLRNVWGELTPRQRIAIVQELRGAGQLTIAADLAQHISRPLHFPTDEEHRIGTQIMFETIQALGATDMAAGQQTLDHVASRATETMEGMQHVLSQDAHDIPHYEDAMRVFRNAQHIRVQADACRAVMLAGSETDAARLLVDALQPSDENILLRDEYHATVARGFAAAGHFTDAIAFAERIAASPEPDAHGHHLRSRVFTDIAQAMRQHRTGE